MPRYDYKCEYCATIKEHDVSIEDRDKHIFCPYCFAGYMYRVLVPTNVGIEFKGTGFFSTDYKSGKDG